MSVLRQIAIHNFSLTARLPREMADEILGFCFYDTATAVHRAVQRANMAQVVDRFAGAWISRANTPEMNDTQEQWAINLVRLDQDEDNEVQFQATNCRICGNYKHSNTFVPDIGIEEFQLLTLEEFNAVFLEVIPVCIRCNCQ
jgi:hypothetical protein